MIFTPMLQARISLNHYNLTIGVSMLSSSKLSSQGKSQKKDQFVKQDSSGGSNLF